MPKKFFILAGEASGDMHAARLISAMTALEPGARFIGMGGAKMIAAGLEPAKDLEGMQVVGFWEVAKHFFFFKKVFEQLLDRLKQERPDALICVDYPGFNLRFAKEARKLGIPVLYYIAPQVWAWKPGRAKSMAQYVDRCYCVFDFEPPWFEQHGLKSRFVGHPLLDAEDAGIPRPAPKEWLLPAQGAKLVGLFPGSRENELRCLQEPLCDAVKLLQKDNSVGPLAGWVNLPPGVPTRWLAQTENRPESAFPRTGFHAHLAAVWPDSNQVQALRNKLDAQSCAEPCALPALAAAADFNVVKSGTSTLQAGLAGRPMCAVYKASNASYVLARLLVNIPVFSLVNIVLGRYAVPELLQSEASAARIAEEIRRGLTDEAYRARQMQVLSELRAKLGGPGASRRTAQLMLACLSGND